MPSSLRSTYSRIGKPKDGTIRLWTIQPMEVWESLCREKILLVDPEHPRCSYKVEYRDAYDWMREQMKCRLPSYEGNCPWWAYDYKMDLRSYRYQTYPPNERYVRIELAVPVEKVLICAYEAWFWVLNKWYLAEGTDEEFFQNGKRWEEEAKRAGVNLRTLGPLPEPWQSQMVASWQRIFDLDFWRDDTVMQATFEKLQLDEVVAITEFTSCDS